MAFEFQQDEENERYNIRAFVNQTTPQKHLPQCSINTFPHGRCFFIFSPNMRRQIICG